ncbi:MAG TPA: hypothetical protein VJN90_00835 [Candidatus Acidoferrales bacterium]|nr:hypothetical protein [Candidatus Acidoferrales bacterium]
MNGRVGMGESKITAVRISIISQLISERSAGKGHHEYTNTKGLNGVWYRSIR